MVTIKDVAQAAQVSISTVSHVINGTRYVSDELRLRVLDAMETLGYRPNVLARSLRRGSTATIGLILPDNANMFFAEIAREIEDLGFQNGYNVILCNSNDNPIKELNYTNTLLQKQVDGMLFISTGGSGEAVQRILAEGVPVVIVDRELDGVETDCILLDNFQGGYLAGQYLIGLGHRKFGCISGPSELTPSHLRVQGFLQAIQDAGLSFDENDMVSGDFHYESGERSMDQLLSRGDRRFTAVFVLNDMMAIGALRSAINHGLRVPQDLSIIGFDGIALTQAVSPALTSIAQPIQQIAACSIDLLLKQIRAKEKGEQPTNRERMILSPHILEGESCAPLS
ncbi:MAG: LacI family transcriptional regulator [Chloroflexi bacterium]|nr:LacI family transcriptional regulator [Chloroflexota bacterium]